MKFEAVDWRTLGCCRTILEDQNACRKMVSKGCAHEVLEGNKKSVRVYARSHPCYILAKHILSVSSNFSETEFRNKGPVPVIAEIS